jgi:hypothetical protein
MYKFKFVGVAFEFKNYSPVIAQLSTIRYEDSTFNLSSSSGFGSSVHLFWSYNWKQKSDWVNGMQYQVEK